MPNIRMTILAKLLEEEKLHTLAQETGAELEGEVDQTTADQLADQIFDQLFNQVVQNLGK